MSKSDVRNVWAAGTAYEDYMGRWSRRLAARFVSWLQIPGGVHWLDVGCGTGALTDAIYRDAAPASVVGCDPATAFVDFARKNSRATFVVAGAGALPSRAGGYGSITSLLALNFFPDPDGAVREMRSLSAAGGAVSACVWDYAGGMELLRYFWDAAVAIDPASHPLDEGVRFPLCRREGLQALFRSGGLADIRCEAIDIATEFADFDDYWLPMLGGTGPAPSYVASLGEAQRAELAKALERALPRRPDGTIALTARAWAIVARAS